MRYNHSSHSAVGTAVNPKCDGTSTMSTGSGQTALQRSLKSDVVNGDFVKPTPYLAAWVGTHKLGISRSEQNGALCGDGRGGLRYLRIVSTDPMACRSTPQLPGFSGFSLGGTATPAAVYTYNGLNRVADMAILGKIKDQDVDLGVLLGEASETASLFCDLTEDLLMMVKFIRTGKRDPLGFMHYLLQKDGKRDLLNGKPHWATYEKKYKRHMSVSGAHRYQTRHFTKRELTFLGVTSQAAANRWMQYRYGIIPVYNDIINIFDYLVTVSKSQPLISSRVTIPYTTNTIVIGTGYTASDVEVKGFQQLKVWYTVSDPKVRKASQLGYDVLSLPSTLWELTPFSWMIDWAFPVGKSLAALGATRGLSFHCGYRSMRCEVKLKSALNGGTISGVSTLVLEKTLVSYGAFQRTPLMSFPSAHPPVLENPFGYHTGQRITDCLSLLRQFINFK